MAPNPLLWWLDVYELNNVATSGLITVKVSKDALINLTFTGSAITVSSRPVQNSQWSFNPTSDDDYYLLTTNQVILPGGILSFGLSGTLTTGILPVSSVIEAYSGGEVLITNNIDADKIDYFQQ